MRKVVYYLSTCDTCKRIMGGLPLDGFDKIDIKNNPLSEAQLEELYTLHPSYEGLFNKRAQKYRQQKLNEASLSEDDFKRLLLEEYTFLKRPVFIVGSDIFVGNSKKTVQQLQEKLS